MPTDQDGAAHAPRALVVQRCRRGRITESKELVFDIYSRFSTDEQHQSSIERQNEVCHAYAERIDARVNSEQSDPASTGMTMVGREALARVRANIKSGRVNGILIEEVDRLTRDEADLHNIARLCRHHGAEIHEARFGKLEGANLSFKGYMAAAARERLVWLTSMGMRGAAEEGRTNGRPRFGYRPDPYRPGVRVIDDGRAGVVRKLYAMCAAGVGTEDLARWMSERFPTPSQLSRLDRRLGLNGPWKPWTAQMINALLRSPFYRGITIYGARSVVRDPETHRVIAYRENPEEDWIPIQNEALRIVDDETWQTVQSRIQGRYFANRRTGGPRRSLLSSAVACVDCGNPLATYTNQLSRSYKCTTAGCGGCARPRVAWVEHAVLTGLGQAISGDAIRRYRDAIVAGQAERRRSYEDTRTRWSKELGQLEDSLDHTFTIGAMEGASVEIKRKFRQKLMGQIADYQHRIAALARPDRDISNEANDTEFSGGLRRMLAQLPFKATTPEAAALVLVTRRMVRSVVVSEARAGAVFELEVVYDLRPLVFVDPTSSDEPLSVRATIAVDADERYARDREAGRESRDGATAERFQDFVETIPKALLQRATAALGRDAIEISDRAWRTEEFIATTLFLLKTATDPRKMPNLAGPSEQLLPALTFLARSGGWERVATEIRRNRPELVDATRAELMAGWTKLTSRKSAGPASEQAARAVRLAQDSRECPDARTARRMLCLSLLLEQAGQARILRETGVPLPYLQTWTTVCDHLAGRDLPPLTMRDPPVLPGDGDIGDVASFERMSERATCPDVHANALLQARDLAGWPPDAIAREFGWSTKTVTRWLRRPFAERTLRLAEQVWHPRQTALLLPERFMVAATALSDRAAASVVPRRRQALAAVSLHLRGRTAEEIEQDCSVPYKLLAALLDVYGVLGIDGMLLAATSPAVRCPPNTMAIAEEAMMAEADELLRQAEVAPDATAKVSMTAVARDIQGVSRSEISARTGIRPTALPSHILRYRRGGVAVLQPVKRAAPLTPEQIDELRTIVADGTDPLDPTRSVNLPTLMAYCASRYDRTFRMYTFRQIMRRHGVRLAARKPQPTRTQIGRLAEVTPMNGGDQS